MVNLAVCAMEGSKQKARLLVSLKGLGSSEVPEGQDSSVLCLTVQHNSEDVRVNCMDVSSDRLDLLKYSAFDIDMFLVLVPPKEEVREFNDLEAEHVALLKEIVENFPNTTLVLLESVKTQASNLLGFSFRKHRPVLVKPVSKSTVMKYSKGVNVYHVKCDVTNQTEVTELISNLVKEDYATLNWIAEKILPTSTVLIDETDSSVPLLWDQSSIQREPSFSFNETSFVEMTQRVLPARQKAPLLRQETVLEEPIVDEGLLTPNTKRRREGQVSKRTFNRSPSSSPRCRNRKDSLLFCDCNSLRFAIYQNTFSTSFKCVFFRSDTDDFLLSNQITAMSPACAENYLSSDFIWRSAILK